MNKQHFIEVLKNPALLSEKTLDPLKEILEEYPFFQAGRMLWIKNLHQLDHIRYNNELKLAAAHISDRARLFELVHHTVSFAESEVPEIQEEPTAHSVEAIESNSAVSLEEQEQIAFEDINYFQVDDVFTTPQGTEYDYSHREFNTDQPEREVFEGEESIVLPAGDLLGYELSDAEAYQLPTTHSVSSINEARSFSEWLHVLKHEESFIQEEKSPVEEKPVKKKDLIESFLQQSSARRIRIEPTAKEVVENVDISLESMQEHDDLMTETLANIYIKQKQFLKAIDVFHRLSLKYPEKNIYFAQRIEELQDQINNQ